MDCEQQDALDDPFACVLSMFHILDDMVVKAGGLHDDTQENTQNFFHNHSNDSTMQNIHNNSHQPRVKQLKIAKGPEMSLSILVSQGETIE